MQGGGPNDTSFGPQIHFFLFVYPLTVSSLIRVYTNDTHRRELLLAGWILPRPPTTMAMTTWCRRRRQLLYSKRQHRRELLLAGWVPTPAPDVVSSCTRRGSQLRVLPDTGATHGSRCIQFLFCNYSFNE